MSHECMSGDDKYLFVWGGGASVCTVGVQGGGGGGCKMCDVSAVCLFVSCGVSWSVCVCEYVRWGVCCGNHVSVACVNMRGGGWRCLFVWNVWVYVFVCMWRDMWYMCYVSKSKCRCIPNVQTFRGKNSELVLPEQFLFDQVLFCSCLVNQYKTPIFYTLVTLLAEVLKQLSLWNRFQMFTSTIHF